MDQFLKFTDTMLNPVEKGFTKVANPILNNQLIVILVSWLVVVSIVYSVDEIPVQLKIIIKNPFFRAFITLCGLYVATKDFTVAVIATVGLLLIYHLSIYMKEQFEMVFPEPNVYPGCTNVTVNELVALFDNDIIKLKKMMYKIGVPTSLSLTDYNAPLIATYLMNHGQKISSSCAAPGSK